MIADDCTASIVPTIELPLVNRFYKACRYPGKAGRGEVVFQMRHGNDLIGAVRLTPKQLTPNQPSWFLRSMCVAPEYRGQALGSALLMAMLPHLDLQFTYCFPFAYLHDFYAQAGFEQRQDADVSAEITMACQRYRQQGRDIIIMTRDASRLSDGNQIN